jgi:hypothetical protein
LVYLQTKSYFTNNTVDIPTAAKARLARMNTANITNPGFSLTAAGMGGTFTESAFYLSVFGDPVQGEAPTEWVDVFFRKFQAFRWMTMLGDFEVSNWS